MRAEDYKSQRKNRDIDTVSYDRGRTQMQSSTFATRGIIHDTKFLATPRSIIRSYKKKKLVTGSSIINNDGDSETSRTNELNTQRKNKGRKKSVSMRRTERTEEQ